MTTIRTRVALVAGALVIPALAGCSTNFNSPTDQIYNPAVGVSDRSGTVDVINAVVVTGLDGSGTVVAQLVNKEDEPDQLVGVTVDGQPATIPPTADTAIPGTSQLNLADPAIVLASGDKIKPGNYVSITFNFANAEAITLDTPVFTNEGDFATIPVKQPR